MLNNKSDDFAISKLTYLCVVLAAPGITSLVPGRCGYNVWCIILKQILGIDILNISLEIAIR